MNCVAPQVAQLVRSVFSEVKEIEAHGGYQSFEVAQGFRMSEVFREFERAKAELGLENYTLSQTNLEQVVIVVAVAVVASCSSSRTDRGNAKSRLRGLAHLVTGRSSSNVSEPSEKWPCPSSRCRLRTPRREQVFLNISEKQYADGERTA